jgi:hypothetical protein
MEIKLTLHAMEKAIERGATENEIVYVILEGADIPAKKGRKAKEMVFSYNKEWYGKFYHQKKVEVIYVEENEEIIVITLKVCYGEWSY